MEKYKSIIKELSVKEYNSLQETVIILTVNDNPAAAQKVVEFIYQLEKENLINQNKIIV